MKVYINDTHRKKLVFYSIQYKDGWLAASDLDMFTQSIKFYYTFYYQVISCVYTHLYING